jgi:hypothetical protein
MKAEASAVAAQKWLGGDDGNLGELTMFCGNRLDNATSFTPSESAQILFRNHSLLIAPSTRYLDDFAASAKSRLHAMLWRFDVFVPLMSEPTGVSCTGDACGSISVVVSGGESPAW